MRQRHVDLHEFEVSMIYRVPEQLELFATQRNPVTKKQKSETQTRQI